jgi:hypothetical protein
VVSERQSHGFGLNGIKCPTRCSIKSLHCLTRTEATASSISNVAAYWNFFQWDFSQGCGKSLPCQWITLITGIFHLRRWDLHTDRSGVLVSLGCDVIVGKRVFCFIINGIFIQSVEFHCFPIMKLFPIVSPVSLQRSARRRVDEATATSMKLNADIDWAGRVNICQQFWWLNKCLRDVEETFFPASDAPRLNP